MSHIATTTTTDAIAQRHRPIRDVAREVIKKKHRLINKAEMPPQRSPNTPNEGTSFALLPLQPQVSAVEDELEDFSMPNRQALASTDQKEDDTHATNDDNQEALLNYLANLSPEQRLYRQSLYKRQPVSCFLNRVPLEAGHRSQRKSHIGCFVGKWPCQNRTYESTARQGQATRRTRWIRGLDGNDWSSGKDDAFVVDPVESKDWVKLRVYSSFEGFAYTTRGPTPKLASCLLLAYCVLALSHVLYAGITGISSTCWDSIGEVTALAVSSTPSALLRNTCAGITELSIFKIAVRVLAFPDGESSDGEHLELVFGELDKNAIQHQVIKQNRVYGTMPLFPLGKSKLI